MIQKIIKFNLLFLAILAVSVASGVLVASQAVIAGLSAQAKGISVSGGTLSQDIDNVIWAYADAGSNAASHLLKLQTVNGASYTDRLRVGIDGTLTLGNASVGAELRLGKYATKPSCVSSTNEGAVVYDTANDALYYCGPSDVWVKMGSTSGSATCQLFTSSDTFSKPAGVTSVNVLSIGGGTDGSCGGTGRNAPTEFDPGGGGGGGGGSGYMTIKNNISVPVNSNNYTVTVGNGNSEVVGLTGTTAMPGYPSLPGSAAPGHDGVAIGGVGGAGGGGTGGLTVGGGYCTTYAGMDGFTNETNITFGTYTITSASGGVGGDHGSSNGGCGTGGYTGGGGGGGGGGGYAINGVAPQASAGEQGSILGTPSDRGGRGGTGGYGYGAGGGGGGGGPAAVTFSQCGAGGNGMKGAVIICY